MSRECTTTSLPGRRCRWAVPAALFLSAYRTDVGWLRPAALFLSAYRTDVGWLAEACRFVPVSISY